MDELVLAYLEKVDEVWTGQLHEAAEGIPAPDSRAHRGPQAGIDPIARYIWASR